MSGKGKEKRNSIRLGLAILACVLTLLWGMANGTAVEIRNTATAQGDDLPAVVTSNSTSFTAAPAQLELIKTADRAAAEPGDTAVYRLILRNVGSSGAENITITDQLPLGVNFLEASVQGVLTQGGQGNPVQLAVTREQRLITFRHGQLPARATLTIVYAALITPDAVRGNGRNVAQESRSNMASYVMAIRPGILADCGTLIGRVFEDRNFDGEQQPGEPGIPGAIVFLNNGNRITTDQQGLFSMANVLAGHHLGTLDLSSIPGYTLAPNHYVLERNSLARWVRLEPGGLARMNFAVMPLPESATTLEP
ncbi:MAG: DUF11 domain-containing protein [Spirulina sp. DLM2.Bin59]|nr:MAG: DUF11 domain-containing protein [Spirulina sp. DLM2.Bin59]